MNAPQKDCVLVILFATVSVKSIIVVFQDLLGRNVDFCKIFIFLSISIQRSVYIIIYLITFFFTYFIFFTHTCNFVVHILFF